MSNVTNLLFRQDNINGTEERKSLTNIRFEFVRTKWNAFPIEIAEVIADRDSEETGQVRGESDSIGFWFEIPSDYKLDPKELPEGILDLCAAHRIKDTELETIYMLVNAALQRDEPLRLLRKWSNRHRIFEGIAQNG